MCPSDIAGCAKCNPFVDNALSYVSCVNSALDPSTPYEVPICSPKLPDALLMECEGVCSPATNTAVGTQLCMNYYANQASLGGALSDLVSVIEPPFLPTCPEGVDGCNCDPKTLTLEGYMDCLAPFKPDAEMPYCSAKLSFPVYKDCLSYCQDGVAESKIDSAADYVECLLESIKGNSGEFVGKFFGSKKPCDPCSDDSCVRDCDPWVELCPFKC